MAAPISEQLNVLSERYLEILLSDRGNTLLLLVQAPIIAWIAALNWGDIDTPTNSLYYVLALTALWFGTFNACREIVKEKPIFEREVRRGLEVGPYLASKMLVLGLLSFVQCLLLAGIVDRAVPLGGPVLGHFFFLWLTSLGGTAMGLCLSSVMSNSDRAMAGVVLLLIPQMLFSEMVLNHDHASNLVLWGEDLTFITWTFQGMKEITKNDWTLTTLLQSVVLIGLLAGACLTGAYLVLKLRTRRLRGA
jgi:hypothetical protein